MPCCCRIISEMLYEIVQWHIIFPNLYSFSNHWILCFTADANREHSDQTAQIHRLFWVFLMCTLYKPAAPISSVTYGKARLFNICLSYMLFSSEYCVLIGTKNKFYLKFWLFWIQFLSMFTKGLWELIILDILPIFFWYWK